MQLNSSKPGAATARSEPAPALLAAALLLPGLAATCAQGQSPPEVANLSARLLEYRDWQAGASRIAVDSPAFRLITPIGSTWDFAGSLTHDAVSGASPLYHNTLSGASGKGVTEHRTAGEAKFSKYFGDDAVAFGASVSSERDYLSRALQFEWRHWSADRNTTLTLGGGGAADRLDPVNGVAHGAARHTVDLALAVSRVLSPNALLQVNLAHSRGHGYYSDPYKPLDTRPDERRQSALGARLHYYFAAHSASLRLAFRHYEDDWGIHAHTLEAAWHQPMSAQWWLMPSMRYYTQSAATFYHDPPFPAGWRLGGLYSADTRLAAYGALAPALTLGWEDGAWHADLRLEAYRQKADWRMGGSGSPGIEGLSARMISIGVARDF